MVTSATRWWDGGTQTLTFKVVCALPVVADRAIAPASALGISQFDRMPNPP
jgi:hypothetical protein